jgi:hypothetical protein
MKEEEFKTELIEAITSTDYGIKEELEGIKLVLNTTLDSIMGSMDSIDQSLNYMISEYRKHKEIY